MLQGGNEDKNACFIYCGASSHGGLILESRHHTRFFLKKSAFCVEAAQAGTGQLADGLDSWSADGSTTYVVFKFLFQSAGMTLLLLFVSTLLASPLGPTVQSMVQWPAVQTTDSPEDSESL